MAQLSNRNQAVVLRQARLLVPLSLAILALVGVTVRPSLKAQAARVELEAAKLRLGEREREASVLAGMLRERSLERSQQGLSSLRRLVPTSLPALLAHGAVRDAARRSGVELKGLNIGVPLGGGLNGARDRLRALGVELSGAARLSQLVALMEELKALGLPATVLEFSVHRQVASQDQFEFTLDLGLFFRAPREESTELEPDWASSASESSS